MPGALILAHMRAITIASGKGGTGKTSLVFHLAHLLSRDGLSVLAIDADAQASLTWAMDIDAGERATLADVLNATNATALRRALVDATVRLSPTLDVIPAGVALVGVELSLVGRMGRETVMRRALATAPRAYDVAIIDTAPGLGLLTINALAASDGVLIPLVADGVSIHAADTLLATLDELRTVTGAGRAELLGVVLNAYSPNLTHHVAGAEELRAAGIQAMRSVIGRSVKVAESMAAHRPITEHDKDNPRANEYKRLASEVKQWLKSERRAR